MLLNNDNVKTIINLYFMLYVDKIKLASTFFWKLIRNTIKRDVFITTLLDRVWYSLFIKKSH